MTQTPIAEDFDSIHEHLKNLEERKENPQKKWGIWFADNFDTWVHVEHKNLWRAVNLYADLCPTLYASRAEAQEAIDMRGEYEKDNSEVREYPGE